MVSIRKRRHLSLPPVTHKVSQQAPKFIGQQEFLEPRLQKTENSISQEDNISDCEITEKHDLHTAMETPVFSGSSSSKIEIVTPIQDRELKRRKRQRRKHLDNQEPCMMRGVYFKNMKWQAAIKVEKKQIHLGTVSSMEEAAHLYDRAAYMCGREPNFELSEEEKTELQDIKWEDFLAMTRRAIVNKKTQKKIEAGIRRKQVAGFDATLSS